MSLKHGDHSRLPPFLAFETVVEIIERDDGDEMAELDLEHLSPRVCPGVAGCPGCPGCPGGPVCKGSLYECTLCGYGPTRLYHYKVDADGQNKVLRLLAASSMPGKDLALEIVGALEGTDASHAHGRYMHRNYVGCALQELAESMSGLMETLARVSHYTDRKGVEYPLSSVWDHLWVLIRDAPFTMDGIQAAILSTLEDAGPVVLEWSVQNMSMFTRDEARRTLLLKHLERWSVARDGLKSKCSMTRLCDQFIWRVGFCAYSMLCRVESM